MNYQDSIIELRGLCKFYGGVKALNDVSFALERGRIHALMGENGAGKSTLIKLLSGVEEPTSGEIYFCGDRITSFSPLNAHNLGISTVYQEPIQVMAVSISENIYAGRLPKNKLGFVDKHALHDKTVSLMQSIGITLDPDALLSSLSIAQRQLVEILKAISFDSQLIIFDEPTSSLTFEETEMLYRIIRDLKKRGVTVVYISHRLEETFALCDTVTVLRDGRFVAQKPLKELDYDAIVRLMVGRNVEMYTRDHIPGQDVVLQAENLENDQIHGVSFSVRRGEILGIGGLVGAGRTEVLRALFGIDKYNGNIYIDGIAAGIKTPAKAIRAGIALVPEDRKTLGLVLSQSITYNVSVADMFRHKWLGFLDVRWEGTLVGSLIERLRIRTPGGQELAGNLSGGNQQKVVFAKWMATSPKILLLDEPTRGVDVGAKAEIYQIIDEMAKNGTAIVMVSSDMPELMAMSDRILVMKDGHVSGEIRKEDVSETLIMKYALKSEGEE